MLLTEQDVLPGFNFLIEAILKSIYMKNSLQTNPVILKIIVLVTCFMMAMFYNQSKAAATASPTSTASHFFTMK